MTSALIIIDMQQGSLRPLLNERRDEVVRCFACACRSPARLACYLRRAVPHAIGASSSPCWCQGNRMRRGKDDVTLCWQGCLHRIYRHQRRFHGNKIRLYLGIDASPQPRVPTCGARQKQRKLRVLCIVCHGLG